MFTAQDGMASQHIVIYKKQVTNYIYSVSLCELPKGQTSYRKNPCKAISFTSELVNLLFPVMLLFCYYKSPLVISNMFSPDVLKLVAKF